MIKAKEEWKTRKSGKSNFSQREKKSRVARQLPLLLFGLSFILAYLSWRWFSHLLDYVIGYGFRYTPTLQPVHWLWYAIVGFLYIWFTFLVIGEGGTFIVAAWLWKRKKVHKKCILPHVSFVILTYNEEKRISRCVASLFKCAAYYLGFCEVIVVDDGSDDYTYEIAWATIERNTRQWPQVRGKVVRYSVNMGKVEAIRTGVNKVMGSVIAVTDADSWW